MARGNKAHRDAYISILAEVKEMMRHLHPALQKMNKTELRRRLALKGVRLNERKFYDQPYGHGVEFLGSHIRPLRIILNDSTCRRAMTRVDELNAAKDKPSLVDQFLSSLNSYTGLLKTRTEHKRLQTVRDAVSDDWYNYVEWDDSRQCVTARPQYKWRNRINNKYHLKLKAS